MLTCSLSNKLKNTWHWFRKNATTTTVFFDENTIKTSLKGITKMYHFRFSNTHSGKVFVKSKSSDSERLITLRKEHGLPHLIIFHS